MPALTGTRVGFVGAGRIGRPMVSRLVRAGAQVSVFARSAESRHDLAEIGARLADSVASVGRDAEVVVSCLYSDAQLNAMSDELLGGLEPGAVLVSHTTGSPQTIRAIAAAARSRGADAVDASFSGTAEDVLAGRLTVLLGGRPDSVDRAEVVLRSYAGMLLRTGGLGSALTLKLINNLVFAANVQVSLEVARLADDFDVALADVLAVLAESSGGTRVLDYLSRYPDASSFCDQVQPFLQKDLAVCQEVAAGMDVDLGFLAHLVHTGPMCITQS